MPLEIQSWNHCSSCCCSWSACIWRCKLLADCSLLPAYGWARSKAVQICAATVNPELAHSYKVVPPGYESVYYPVSVDISTYLPYIDRFNYNPTWLTVEQHLQIYCSWGWLICHYCDVLISGGQYTTASLKEGLIVVGITIYIYICKYIYILHMSMCNRQGSSCFPCWFMKFPNKQYAPSGTINICFRDNSKPCRCGVTLFTHRHPTWHMAHAPLTRKYPENFTNICPGFMIIMVSPMVSPMAINNKLWHFHGISHGFPWLRYTALPWADFSSRFCSASSRARG